LHNVASAEGNISLKSSYASSCAWNNTAASGTSKRSSLKEILASKTHGGTTKQINSRGFIGKVGGGNVANCIQNNYEKDFITEAKLRDLRYQEHKSR
jgi:hypothetical protein